jgi:hypothetical protein
MKTDTPRARSLTLSLIELRMAETALSHRSCSVFPGGFAHALNCDSQSRDIFTRCGVVSSLLVNAEFSQSPQYGRLAGTPYYAVTLFASPWCTDILGNLNTRKIFSHIYYELQGTHHIPVLDILHSFGFQWDSLHLTLSF